MPLGISSCLSTVCKICPIELYGWYLGWPKGKIVYRGSIHHLNNQTLTLKILKDKHLPKHEFFNGDVGLVESILFSLGAVRFSKLALLRNQSIFLGHHSKLKLALVIFRHLFLMIFLLLVIIAFFVH